MNRLGKIALVLAAGFAAATVYRKQKRKNKGIKNFTAPDGVKYAKNQTYTTSKGETFKNGKKVHLDRGVIPAQENQSVYMKNDDSKVHSKYAVEQNTQYHQKGTRHR